MIRLLATRRPKGQHEPGVPNPGLRNQAKCQFPYRNFFLSPLRWRVDLKFKEED